MEGPDTIVRDESCAMHMDRFPRVLTASGTYFSPEKTFAVR
jgi:hypothetical protein